MVAECPNLASGESDHKLNLRANKSIGQKSLLNYINKLILVRYNSLVTKIGKSF